MNLYILISLENNQKKLIRLQITNLFTQPLNHSTLNCHQPIEIWRAIKLEIYCDRVMIHKQQIVTLGQECLRLVNI